MCIRNEIRRYLLSGLCLLLARTTANANGLSLDSVTATCYIVNTATVEACSASKAGDSVKVDVTYTYRMIWPLTFGTQIPMSSSVTFMLE